MRCEIGLALVSLAAAEDLEMLCNEYYVHCRGKNVGDKVEWFLNQLWDRYSSHSKKS